jgi:soluble lytic murein transglycosylase
MRAFAKRRRLLGAALLWSGAVACTASSPASDAHPQPDASKHLLAVGRPVQSAARRAIGNASWAEALRMERWADAARLIDALPKAERSDALVRYARARAAMELEDAAQARALLVDLERELPELRTAILEQRAELELEVGPFEAAAAHYAKRNEPEAWLKAALAFERAGDLKKARALTERVLARAAQIRSKSAARKLQVEARALRARLCEKLGQRALAGADLRWLATVAPTSPYSAGIDARLGELLPRAALTPAERLERAAALASVGRVEDTDRELAQIENALRLPGERASALRSRGMARFAARRDYEAASEFLAKAAGTSPVQADKDLFYAARALSRGHQDDRAIELYEALAKRFPRSSWAEHARFLAARLTYVAGRWSAAADAYNRYLTRHRAGRYDGNAKFERAVAWLADGQALRAAQAFAEQSRTEQEPRTRARLLELEGTAWFRGGAADRAAERYREAIREQPLSFAALASAARLQQLELVPPAQLEPGAAAAPLPPLELSLPRSVELLRQAGLDRDAEIELTAHASLLHRRHAPRGSEALCEAYGTLSGASERYRVGQRAARPEALNRTPTAASRWLWECVYPRPYGALVRELSAKEELPGELIYAIMRQESAFRPAVGSPAGAVGLMQLLESTAQALATEIGVEFAPERLTSPPYNVELAARYLRKLLDMFGGNVALAAASYNAGPQAVSRWLESGEQLPLDLFVARIPYDETREYVERVVGNLARYAYLSGGNATVPKLALDIEKGLRAPADAY